MKRLWAVVERPDGSTFEQEIDWPEGDTMRQAVERYAKTLGKSYRICDFRGMTL